MSNTDTTPRNNPRTGRRRWNGTDLGLIAVFAALVAGAALVPGLALNGFGVPITFQTLAVMLTGLVLGPARGFAAVGLYTLLGLAGLPIFSQGRSGLGILAGPSAGYIIAFPIAAGIVGWLATIVIRRTTKARALWFFLAATLTSIVVVHTLGIFGIALNSKATLEQAFLTWSSTRATSSRTFSPPPSRSPSTAPSPTSWSAGCAGAARPPKALRTAPCPP